MSHKLMIHNLMSHSREIVTKGVTCDGGDKEFSSAEDKVDS